MKFYTLSLWTYLSSGRILVSIYTVPENVKSDKNAFLSSVFKIAKLFFNSMQNLVPYSAQSAHQWNNSFLTQASNPERVKKTRRNEANVKDTRIESNQISLNLAF